jgi:hypothetical protein
MRGASKHVYWICALVLGGCTTASGERPGFIQSMQQVVGAASMAVGLKAGDTGMAQKGADMFGQGLGAQSNTNPGSVEPAGSPRTTTPGPVAQGGGGNHDLQAIANRCGQIAREKYWRQQQNELMMQAGCLAYCAHNITGIQRYHDMYVENQRNARSLCSAGTSPSCNTIDQQACRYR